jgi:putative tryptophan/tyrosine transport system substrate-binding protein
MQSRFLVSFFFLTVLLGCGGSKENPTLPSVGYVLHVQDETLEEAKRGFYDALKDGGFEDGKTVKMIYQNANGEIPTLNNILDYFIAQKVTLIATNPTVATIAAVAKTETIPVCMMVSPRPDLAKLQDANGAAPPNLFGVYETLAYIDTSVALIKQVFPNAKRVGTIYNTSEPNSVNSMERLKSTCAALGLQLETVGVNTSNESQQAALALAGKKIDVFFALPDNIIFSSFETVQKALGDKKVPIVTSEIGLVKRGALLAYGADLYEWGRQAGVAAVRVLKGEKNLAPEEVKIRRRVYNALTLRSMNLTIPSGFDDIATRDLMKK